MQRGVCCASDGPRYRLGSRDLDAAVAQFGEGPKRLRAACPPHRQVNTTPTW